MEMFDRETALLVTDMIHDFIDESGALSVPGARRIVPRIAELAKEAREKGAHVIYVNDTHEKGDREFSLWPEHAIRGSEGARIIGGLEPQEGDIVIEKTRYSAFFDTELDETLEKLGIKKLVVTGTVSNICVLSTANDGAMRGYEIIVPADAVAALSDEDQAYTFKYIEQVIGGHVEQGKEG